MQNSKTKEQAYQAYVVEGVKPGHIISGLGVNRSTIYRWIKREGWEQRRTEIINEAKERLEQRGTPVPDAAEWVVERLKLVRASYHAYAQALRENRVQWTPGGLERLIRLEQELLAYAQPEADTRSELVAAMVASMKDLAEASQEAPLTAERVAEIVRRHFEEAQAS